MLLMSDKLSVSPTAVKIRMNRMARKRVRKRRRGWSRRSKKTQTSLSGAHELVKSSKTRETQERYNEEFSASLLLATFRL